MLYDHNLSAFGEHWTSGHREGCVSAICMCIAQHRFTICYSVSFWWCKLQACKHSSTFIWFIYIEKACVIITRCVHKASSYCWNSSLDRLLNWSQTPMLLRPLRCLVLPPARHQHAARAFSRHAAPHPIARKKPKATQRLLTKHSRICNPRSFRMKPNKSRALLYVLLRNPISQSIFVYAC